MKLDRRTVLAYAALVIAGALAVLAVALPDRRADEADADVHIAAIANHWDLVETHCYGCHNFEDWAGEVAFDTMAPEGVPENGEVWEAAVRKLRGGLMPPPGESQPADEELATFVGALEGALDATATATPEPGYVGLHRLNRAEYANAVRDLLGVEIDAAELLPVDAVSGGFDNVAAVLRVSPTFLDQYITAARDVSVLAVGEPPPRPVYAAYRPPPGAQSLRVEGLPPGTRGGMVVEHLFPTDGVYEFSIEELLHARYVHGVDHPHTVILTIDDEKVFEADLGGEDDFRGVDQLEYYVVEQIDNRFKNIRVPVNAGVRRVGATFVARSFAASDELLEPFDPIAGMDRAPQIGQLTILGPFEPGAVGETANRRRIFSCRPDDAADAAEAEACAAEILGRLARRAYRRPITDEDLAALMAFYREGRARAGFETGVQRGIMAILASPNFLYRAAEPPADVAPGQVYALSDLDLATRLSFFIWSSIPDDELLDLAVANRLHEPDVLEAQVRRMLADARSEALVTDFAMKWLRVDDIEALETPDPVVFPDFDPTLLTAFKREMELFLDSVLREPRSVLDLLTADHTFVNERLAKHYGLPVVMGETFQRVELPDSRRWGLLGKGAILAETSYPHRTSPVLRGAWLMENVLGAPPAAPPPGVETDLGDSDPTSSARTTVRERLALHRTEESCASCHAIIDPIGVALENYDALGAWRDRDRFAGVAIDARGELADGTPVEGPDDLRAALLAEPERFVETLTEKLLTYALGRTLEYTDMPTVRAIARGSAAHDHQFSSLVLGVVNSVPFRNQRAPADALADGAAKVRHAALED